MKRVLIMEWDPHAEKYYYFFLFREDTYVQVWDHSSEETDLIPAGIKDPDIHTYDILVFPKPFSLKEWALDYICEQKYQGMLIVEKLLAKSVKEAKHIFERLSEIRFFVFHSRLYAPSFSEFPSGNENRVAWPCSGYMSPWYNILPNYLDEVFQKRHQFPQIKNISNEKDKIHIEFEDSGSLMIYSDSTKVDKVTLNENAVEWPNYFVGMKRFFDNLEQEGICQTENFDYEIRLLQRVEQIYNLRR